MMGTFYLFIYSFVYLFIFIYLFICLYIYVFIYLSLGEGYLSDLYRERAKLFHIEER